ncbi:unnamed protein product [Arctia plantaginis]|uniref:Uncharacterized protein n=1 Tax=Arctia plantaginis TaxID=874455 RepID=A0A8S1BAX4_ARCPL|nr:unnamed protein product [Arctia plantaginis]
MMRIPECLSRRYKALDDLIQELSSSIPSQNSLTEQRSNTSNVGIKLMCDFWNILKEDPDCNLTAEVQHRMGMRSGPELCPNVYGVQRYMTYMAEKCCTDKDGNYKGCKVDKDGMKGCRGSNKSDQDADKDEHKCNKDVANVMNQGKICCKRSNEAPKKQTEVDVKLSGACCSGTKATHMKDEELALTKVLCNLKQAATFDKKCHVRVKELMEAQKMLKEQVQILEAREKEGVKLLKEADCMWLCMEDAYKKKVAESQERQQLLLKQLKEIETSATKWRKNKKDLEFQINNMTKARMEIVEKLNQKKNDIKIMDSENQNLTKRIESAKKDLANSTKSMGTAKEASDARMVNLTEEMVKIQKKTNEERTNMKKKENEGTQYVKEARTDLQNICKVLLQKKLENEDLRAERTAINEEMDLLVTTLSNCKDKCKNKEESVLAELKTLTNEIATFEAKCKKCHICTDTNDVRKLCTDCPKCLQERKCNVGEEDCTSDPTMDCVCMSVKQKFLDNVFDNMYTVLERQSRTQPGKALADAILNSLKRSTNGKLSPQTRRILQEFILSTVKKNLNLTIVGGAVKTRCEMDPDTYKQLMTCLRSVKAVKPPQADKGTPPRKEPCKRWGPSSECNCPKGPKNCICTRKAPPHPDDPRPCPQDKEDIGEQKICPYKDKKVCGPDCGMQGRSSRATRDIGNEIATWRPDPCSGPSCPYNKITRAAMAQCVLGNESMVKKESRKSTCTCRTTPLKSCHCHRDRRRQLREKNIAEVMGRYHVVPPIAKDITLRETSDIESKVCDAVNKLMKKVIVKSKDTKHVKANLVEYCDKYTSVQKWWRDSQKDVRFELPYAKDEFRLQANSTALPHNRQSVNSIACQFNNLESSSNFSSIQDIVSKEFKIAVENRGKFVTQSTVLTKTNSGTFTMELDEQIIESLQKVTNEDPILFVSFKKSDSGCLIVHFDNKNNSVANTQKVALRTTQSGTKFLEIHKNIIDILENSDKYNMKNIRYSSKSANTYEEDKFRGHYIAQDEKKKKFFLKDSHDAFNDQTNETDFKDILRKQCGCIILTHSSCRNCNNSLMKTDESEIIDFIYKDDETANNVERYAAKKINGIPDVCMSTFTEQLQDYSFELQHLFEQGNVKITVQIKMNNELFNKFETVITRSLAGTIGVGIVQLSSLGHIPLDGIEYPVSLSKTMSNTYIVNLDQSSETFNAVFKKSISGNVMLLPTTPQTKNQSKKDAGQPEVKLYKLKVKNYDNCHVELPAVLKLTDSNNFNIVLDKEFESRYKKMVRNDFLSEQQRYVLLQKTPSAYVVDLNTDNHIHHENLNALLVKSKSGNIKIVVKGAIAECLGVTKTKRSPVSSAQVFKELLDKLHTASTNTKNQRKYKPKFVGQKSSSDTQLYERVKIKLQINKGFASDPSAILKKTDSGHYAVILNKESKKTFLKNLRSFLVSNPNGVVPITRTESGEIQLDLKRYGEEKGHYGLLKITSSGNVYVVVDAEAVTTMSSNSNMNSKRSNAVDTRSFNIGEFVNKEVYTTCNGKPVTGVCDISKCICEEIPFETLFWKNNTNGKNTEQVSQPTCWNRTDARTDKVCMKPTLKYNYKPTEHCCYVFDSVCSYHDNRYSHESNELLNKSAIYKEAQQIKIMKYKHANNLEHPQVGKVLWDSLSYLPPQLPPFLRNVQYH